METDAYFRNRIDFRERVGRIKEVNDHELRRSMMHVEEAKSRSPTRRSPVKSGRYR